MEISAILTADILDILFEGRNKEYGAYELRRMYRKRLTLSIAGMLLLTMLLLAGFLLGSNKKDDDKAFVISDPILTKIDEPKKVIPPVIPPAPKLPDVKMKAVTPPRVVPDDQVKDDEKPPKVDELEDAKIGTKNRDGDKDDGRIAPPIDEGSTGITEAPKKVEEDWERTFIKVEKESEYPGGMPAWIRFLKKNEHYPQEAIENEVQGTVVVQFIVDKEGLVSDVQAVSGPNELRGEAERMINKSGKWIPAIQNGRQVKSYKSQPIIFQISSE